MNTTRFISITIRFVRLLIGFLVDFFRLSPNSGFFYNCHLTWVSGMHGKDNADYWEKFGDNYLDDKNNAEYEASRDAYFRDTLLGIVNDLEGEKNSIVIELGGGYFQNLTYLNDRSSSISFYNVDISPIKSELNPDKSNIHLIHSRVEDVENYSALLRSAGLIFTFGLWMYLNERAFIETLRKIVDSLEGSPFFVFAEPYRDLDSNLVSADLVKSHRRKGGTFIHNYEKAFDRLGLKILNSNLSTDNNLGTFVCELKDE